MWVFVGVYVQCLSQEKGVPAETYQATNLSIVLDLPLLDISHYCPNFQDAQALDIGAPRPLVYQLSASSHCDNFCPISQH